MSNDELTALETSQIALKQFTREEVNRLRAVGELWLDSPWEENQEDYRELSEQMDEEWRLAKEWNLPPQFSEPPAESNDVWRLVVKEADGEIPLGQRLNRVGHDAISVIVQFHVAAKHDSGFAVEQHIETLQLGFAQLQQACEKSTAQELAPDVELNVTRLLDLVDELIIGINRYAGDDPEDDDPEDDDACETGEPEMVNQAEANVGLQPPRDFRWGKVSHKGRELQRILRSFTDISEEKSSGGWYPDDVPF